MTAIYPIPARWIPGGVCEPDGRNETALVRRWLSLAAGTRLRDVQGREVFVLTPGRRNRHEGPDVLEARLVIGAELREGPVECHLRPRDWIAHGHDTDPNYQGVILHVVRWVPPGYVTPRIPTVVLSDDGWEKPELCELTPATLQPDYRETLRTLAHRRWQRHQEQFRRGPVTRRRLLEACFRILGAGGNTAAWNALARALDPRVIRTCPAAAGGQYLADLARRSGLTFYRCGIRPAHRWSRRLPVAVALVDVLWKYSLPGAGEEGTFLHRLNQAIGPHCGVGLRVELAGNVWYPFLATQALNRGDWDLFRQVQVRWYALRLPYTYGELERRFRGILSPAEMRRFWVLQGLLALQRSHCRQRLCRACPLRGDHGRLE
jgi:hypothetical protein